MTHGLLNPPAQADACDEMIGRVAGRLDQLEHKLTHTTMDREAYLQTIGAVVELRAMQSELEKTKRRYFQT